MIFRNYHFYGFFTAYFLYEKGNQLDYMFMLDKSNLFVSR